MRAPTVALRLDELGDLQHMTQALVLDDGTLVYLAEFVVGGKGEGGAVHPGLDAAIRVVVDLDMITRQATGLRSVR